MRVRCELSQPALVLGEEEKVKENLRERVYHRNFFLERLVD